MEATYPRLTPEGLENQARGFSETFSASHKNKRFEHLIHPVINAFTHTYLRVAEIQDPWNHRDVKRGAMESAKFTWHVIKMGNLLSLEEQESTPILAWEGCVHGYVSENQQFFKETIPEAENRIVQHYQEKIDERLLLLEASNELEIPIDGMKNSEARTVIQETLTERLRLEREAIRQPLPEERGERDLRRGREIKSNLDRNALIVAVIAIVYFIYFAGKNT